MYKEERSNNEKEKPIMMDISELFANPNVELVEVQKDDKEEIGDKK